MENPEKTLRDPEQAEAAVLSGARSETAMGSDSVDTVLAYAMNPDKTQQEKQYFISGVNVDPGRAAESFEAVKEQYQKTDGILCWHAVQSFQAGEISPEEAHRVGVELARKVWGDRFQVVITTHLNTEHLHNHFVVNSVSFRDGLKLADREKFAIGIQKMNDEICREHGLSVPEDPKRGRSLSYDARMAEKEGLPTRIQLLRDILDQGIEQSRNLPELEQYLRKNKCRYDFDPNHKYWTITPRGYQRPIRLYRLGDEYDRIALLNRLRENEELAQAGLFHPVAESPDVLPRKIWSSAAVSRSRRNWKAQPRYYRMYLYFCHLLGIEPNGKRPMFRAVSTPWQVRQAQYDFRRINEKTALLVVNRIGTEEELQDFRGQCEGSLRQLQSEREFYRHRFVASDDEEEKERAREEFQKRTKAIREQRKNLKLIDEITMESKTLEQQLQAMDQEQERNGKEDEPLANKHHDEPIRERSEPERTATERETEDQRERGSF